MSLDVYLHRDLLDVDSLEKVSDCVYESNITHNLAEVAGQCGCYEACWRPEDIAALYARDIIPKLEAGLLYLTQNRAALRKYEPDNGWGTVDDFERFLNNYLQACKTYPHARIDVCR